MSMSVLSNTITDEHCHYVIIHHNQELVNKVIFQFENIISQNKQFPWTVMESPTIIVDTLLNLTSLCKNSCKIISQMMNPPLIIEHNYNSNNNLNGSNSVNIINDNNDNNNSKRISNFKHSRLILTFDNEFVSFNHRSMIDYGLKNFNKKCWNRGLKQPTCFVYLFNQFEASILVESSKNNNNDESGSSSESDESVELVGISDDSDNDSDDNNNTSEDEDETDSEDDNDNSSSSDVINCTPIEKEREEFLDIYGFVTRFFTSVFDNSQHIHLFVRYELVL